MEDNLEVIEQEGTVETVTYTEAELQAKLQAETDRRVTMALTKEREKFKTQVAEAEKLKAMNDEQKKVYVFEKEKKAFDEQRKEFSLLQNKVAAQSILAEKGLPLAMIEYIVAEDAETMNSRINSFEQMFNSAVNDAIGKRISSPSPRAAATSQTGMTREKFRTLSLEEQAEIYRSNQTLYKQLV